MKIATIQIDIEFGNPAKNRIKVIEMIEKAVQNKPDVIMLPEMWNTSFQFKNIHVIADKKGEPTKSIISNLAKRHGVNIIAGSIADKHEDLIFNRLYVANRQGIISAHYDKVHLVRHVKEHEYLKAGKKIQIFKIDDVQCGAVICYDIRFPELSRTIALEGAKILFIPAQWPETRIDHWKALVIARAIENQIYVVAVNRVGSELKANFPGNSIIVDPWGKIVAESGNDECIMHAMLDVDLVDRVRKKIPCFQDRNVEAYCL